MQVNFSGTRSPASPIVTRRALAATIMQSSMIKARIKSIPSIHLFVKMAPQKNVDEKVKVEMYLPMTTFKRLLLWCWIKGQSRAELCANTFAARAEANEAQFMADIARRAQDKGMTAAELEQQIYEQAGLRFEVDRADEDNGD